DRALYVAAKLAIQTDEIWLHLKTVKEKIRTTVYMVVQRADTYCIGQGHTKHIAEAKGYDARQPKIWNCASGRQGL
ncbi:hypothetical protein HAX54_034991, partial [Datura stramonium]|nr:hypothetical protein [Datura stramonium]